MVCAWNSVVFTCMSVFFHPKGHHLRPQKQQDGPVLLSQRGPGGWGQAWSPGGVHLWRGVGLRRPLHILSAGQADGWGAGCHRGLPRLHHLPQSKASQGHWILPLHWMSLKTRGGWGSLSETEYRSGVGAEIETAQCKGLSSPLPDSRDCLFPLWCFMRLTLYLSVLYCFLLLSWWGDTCKWIVWTQ